MKISIHMNVKAVQVMRAGLVAAISQNEAPPTGEPDIQADNVPGANSKHLDDSNFLEFGADPNLTPGLAIAEHLAECRMCATEWQRVRSLSAVWQDPDAAARLRTRRRALSRGSDASQPKSVLAVLETALNALLPRSSAFAQGTEKDEAEISFVITEGASVVELSGTLRRRNREYYARIAAKPENVTEFAERHVWLTIHDQGQPLLQRQLEVGVAVLLGTDLPLTSHSTIAAHLLPAEG